MSVQVGASIVPLVPSEPDNPDPALLRAFRDRVRAQIALAIEREDAEAEALRARVVPVVRKALVEAREAQLGKQAWLFGSYAWGKPSPRSDVDLLVEACPNPERLAAFVGRRTGTDVHVVPLEDAPETLRVRAQAEGLPL